MKLAIKTAANPSEMCVIEIDGKSIGFFVQAMDIRLRTDGVKVVMNTIDISTGQKVYATRTFYATDDSVIDIEMEEVDEKSATTKEEYAL